MFSILIKHDFGNSDNHNELINNVKNIKFINEEENCFIRIEYMDYVYKKNEIKMTENVRLSMIALPLPVSLETVNQIQEIVNKADALSGINYGIHRPKDKFLKIVLKHYVESSAEKDLKSEVEIGLTHEGSLYDENEFIKYWSKQNII